MFKITRPMTAKVRLGLVVAATLAVGVGVTAAAAAPGRPQDANGKARTGGEITELADLSDEEIQGIRIMREEEKLARDVYQALFDMWGQPVFQNIANSEQAHMDAVKALIDRYDLDDPVTGNGQGEFTNQDLQALYGELIATGGESLASALRVGAAIEEIDILDLQEHIGETDAADVLRVYESLLRGSRNHLRAFVSTLERETGESHTPQYLDEDAYDAIISGTVETGGWGGRGSGSGQGRSGTRGARSGSGQPSAGAGGNGGNRSPAGAGQGDCLS